VNANFVGIQSAPDQDFAIRRADAKHGVEKTQKSETVQKLVGSHLRSVSRVNSVMGGNELPRHALGLFASRRFQKQSRQREVHRGFCIVSVHEGWFFFRKHLRESANSSEIEALSSFDFECLETESPGVVHGSLRSLPFSSLGEIADLNFAEFTSEFRKCGNHQSLWPAHEARVEQMNDHFAKFLR